MQQALLLELARYVRPEAAGNEAAPLQVWQTELVNLNSNFKY